jgi:hypothetical protein
MLGKARNGGRLLTDILLLLKDGAASSPSTCILDSGVTERKELDYGEASGTRSAKGNAQSLILHDRGIL